MTVGATGVAVVARCCKVVRGRCCVFEYVADCVQGFARYMPCFARYMPCCARYISMRMAVALPSHPSDFCVQQILTGADVATCVMLCAARASPSQCAVVVAHCCRFAVLSVFIMSPSCDSCRRAK